MKKHLLIIMAILGFAATASAQVRLPEREPAVIRITRWKKVAIGLVLFWMAILPPMAEAWLVLPNSTLSTDTVSRNS